MAIRTFVSKENLTEYDGKIKELIATKESNTVYITLSVLSTVTSGTLNAQQLTDLKNAMAANKNVKLVLSVTDSPAYKEYFYMCSDRSAQGYVSFFSDDVANQEITHRAISVTLSTGSWVLLADVNGGSDNKELIFEGSFVISGEGLQDIVTSTHDLSKRKVEILYRFGPNSEVAYSYTSVMIGDTTSPPYIVLYNAADYDTAVPTTRLYVATFSLSSDNKTVTAAVAMSQQEIAFQSSTNKLKTTATNYPGNGYLEILAISVLPDVLYTIEGVYKFKDNVSLPDASILQYCSFGRGQTPTSFFDNMLVNKTNLVFRKGTTSTIVYQNDAWSGSQIVKFNGLQFVSEDFLNWFTANAIAYQTYTFTVSNTHCSANPEGNIVVGSGESATVTFTAASGFKLPATVTVTGAAHTWNQNIGVLVLSNPTADGTVTVTAEQIKIAAPTLSISGSTLSIVTSDNLPSTYTLTATGVGDTKTKSGLLKSGTTTTFDLSTWLTDIGTYTITAVGVNSIYATSDSSNAVTYTVAQPQLATPQNVSADGTTVSWDAVENAISYAVLADGSEIGTVENQTGYNVSVQNVSQHSKAAPFNVGFGYDNGTNIDYSGFPKYISTNSASDIVSLNTGDYANSQGVAPNIIVVGVYSAIIATIENVGTTGGVSFVSIGNPSDYESGSGYSEFGYNQMGIYKIEGDGTISFNGWDND